MLIADQERISKTPAGDGVDILHHATGAVNDSEIVTKQLLTPPAEDPIRAIVIKQSFKRVAISDPVEVTTPENTTNSTDTVTTRASFASHRMVFGFGLGIYSGAISIGVEVGPITIEIKFT